MNSEELSEFILKIMKKRQLSLQKVADVIPISKQGLHNWLQKRKNVNWKLQSLLKLSKLLNFDIVISNGELFVKENENNMIKLNEKAGFIKTSPVNTTVSYEVYKDFKTHSIIKLYTPNTFINDDIFPSLLEGWFGVYNTPEECFTSSHVTTAIPVYALLDNTTNELIETLLPSIYPDDIETAYYLGYATEIKKTEDGFSIVGIDERYGIKIAKAYAAGKIINSSFYPTNLLPDYTDKAILGIAYINMECNSISEFGSWESNTKYMYEHLDANYNWNRYFDCDRNEIFAGDIIEYVGNSDSEFLYEHQEDYCYLHQFGIGDTFKIIEASHMLTITHNNQVYDINALQLLSWKRL